VIRRDKEIVLEKMRARLAEAKYAILINYQGLTVEDTNKLRRDLRGAGAELLVVKNSLMKLASNDTPLSVCSPYLDGPTALALTWAKDPVDAAKIVIAFNKDHPKMEIKAAVVDGELVHGPDVKSLSELPSQELLVARLLGAISFPLTGFVRVLNGPIQGLITALDALRRKRDEEGSSAS